MRPLAADEVPPDWKAQLRVGETTRQAVRRTHGVPSRELPEDGVVTYRLGRDPEQDRWVVVREPWERYQANGWGWAELSLALVFGEDGVLERYAMVRAR